MDRRTGWRALAVLLPTMALAGACAGARPGAGTGVPFDLGASVAALAATGDSLDQAERLLPLVAEPERSSYRRRLGAISGALGDVRADSAAVVRGLRDSFMQGFADLPAAADPSVLAGVRHRPLLATLPQNVVVLVRDGRLEISRTSGGRAYEACLEPGLAEGASAALKFRLQTRWSDGVAPVPYLGIRDERGLEEVLVFLPEDPDPDQVHEIYLRRAGGRLAALYGDGVQTVADERLGEGARIFFQVNGTARIVIDEFRITPKRAR